MGKEPSLWCLSAWVFAVVFDLLALSFDDGIFVRSSFFLKTFILLLYLFNRT